jgi:hypothetical protein
MARNALTSSKQPALDTSGELAHKPRMQRSTRTAVKVTGIYPNVAQTLQFHVGECSNILLGSSTGAWVANSP